MQISWNFRENSKILVAFFKAPTEKPKQIFTSRAKRILIATPYSHKTDLSQLRPQSLFAIID